MIDTWQEIADTVRHNKLRTALTAAGVFWGVLMLLLMQGFGGGLEGAVLRQMGDNATNAVFLWGRRTTLPYRGFQPGRGIGWDNGDVEALAGLQGVRHLAPRLQLGGHRGRTSVVHGSRSGSFQVMGDVPSYRHVQPMIFERGRFLHALDLDEHRKVAVIGKQVRDELFATDEDPIGQTLSIQGAAFQVVGVFRSPRSDDAGDDQTSTVHVPLTTYQRMFHARDRVGWFAVVADDDVSAAEVEQTLRRILSDRHDIHPDDAHAIGSWNSEEEFRKVQGLFVGIRGFVWVVATCTLLSGVVGVSNILLVAVRERTPEIGLRRAVGASRASIVSMVVQEALVLTLLAGYAGIVCGVAVLELVGQAVGAEHEVLANPQVDLGVVLGASVLLAAAGVLAGLLPAFRAAAIPPVDALRGA